MGIPVAHFMTNSLKFLQVLLPFIVLHGSMDILTDPSVSKLLHESASSADKTIKLYPDMWHTITAGEPPENIDLVFSDIITWLDERTDGAGNLRLEREQKAGHDEHFLDCMGKVSTESWKLKTAQQTISVVFDQILGNKNCKVVAIDDDMCREYIYAHIWWEW